MPICIECRYPVSQLYHVSHSNGPRAPVPDPNTIETNSKVQGISTANPSTIKLNYLNERVFAGGEASKRGSGGRDVRLTQCPRCKRFADKYVEHDYVVLFIDLMLVKPQVYRHLLFNRLARTDDQYDPSIMRLGILLVLFEVYITWSNIETLPSTKASLSPVPTLPILLQYAFYLLYCVLTTIAQHLTIRTLARVLVPSLRNGKEIQCKGERDSSNPRASILEASHSRQSSSEDTTSSNPPAPPNLAETKSSARPTALSTALIVSSCMKLFPILMVVWRYDDVEGQVAQGVEWAVAVQNLEALSILLECSYIVASLMVGGGLTAKTIVGRVVLRLAGLSKVGTK